MFFFRHRARPNGRFGADRAVAGRMSFLTPRP